MIVCSCKGISDRQVTAALDEGARSYEALSAAVCDAGTECGMCQGMLRGMLDAHASA